MTKPFRYLASTPERPEKKLSFSILNILTQQAKNNNNRTHKVIKDTTGGLAIPNFLQFGEKHTPTVMESDEGTRKRNW